MLRYYSSLVIQSRLFPLFPFLCFFFFLYFCFVCFIVVIIVHKFTVSGVERITEFVTQLYNVCFIRTIKDVSSVV